jgi:hypothetical protein
MNEELEFIQNNAMLAGTFDQAGGDKFSNYYQVNESEALVWEVGESSNGSMNIYRYTLPFGDVRREDNFNVSDYTDSDMPHYHVTIEADGTEFSSITNGDPNLGGLSSGVVSVRFANMEDANLFVGIFKSMAGIN